MLDKIVDLLLGHGDISNKVEGLRGQEVEQQQGKEDHNKKALAARDVSPLHIRFKY